MSHEVSLVVVLIVLLLADLLIKNKKAFQYLAIAAFALHTVAGFCYYTDMAGDAFAGMYVSGAAQSFVKNILNVGTLLVFFFSFEWNNKENKSGVGEFYFLTLSTLIGMYFMISAGDFLFFYIGLETASIPMAALVAMNKKGIEGAEAAAKYILTASFSSGVMLFGISLIYGACGSLYFDEVQAAFTDITPLHIFALVCFIAGVGFKISLVPFHFWTADTYQGAPTGVTAYLSVISKGAAAFALFTILVKVFGATSYVEMWNEIFFWLIILSITLANLFAIRQQNLKRFMAFSAISQAGYLVLGLMDGSAQGMTALVFYLFVYMAANLGAFAVMSSVEENSGKINICDYNGLYKTNPKLAFLMTLCLFSLAGIPPFAGFFSKFFIFMAAFKGGHVLLVFIALVNTVVSLYYYLLIVKAMYIQPNESPIATFRSDNYTRLALLICTAGVVFLGIASIVYNYIDALSYGLR